MNQVICTFACVALLQHETLLVPMAGGGEKRHHTHVQTLSSWHEIPTHAESSWCSLAVPEDEMTLDVIFPDDKDDALSTNVAVEVRMTLKFQFHLKGEKDPMSCEIPIEVGSEWRPMCTTSSASFDGSGGGMTRWSVHESR